MTLISGSARESGVVIFAGAGVSMLPPTSLPNWYGFNEIVLQSLAARVAAYAKPQVGEWIFAELLERRRDSCHFAPDFMADVIAEEIGFDYFTVVQALDSDIPNVSHHCVAALAKAGIVKAIVTTNFDRLFERALDQCGCAYRRFATFAEFKELASIDDFAAQPAVPVIKVHGTVEDVESMVDTLSQRIAGRPAALESALARLYESHHILFVGFSGADLDYDENYLGLRAAAGANAGFTYLNRAGLQVKPSIDGLQRAWGAAATIVDGQLPRALVDCAGELGIAILSAQIPAAPVDPLAAIQSKASKWSTAMARMQNVNVLSSLIRAAGNEQMAGRLFWGVWKHYRQPEDQTEPAYARFNHLIGRYLLDFGYNVASLRPAESVRIAIGGDTNLDKDLMDNAFQFLARSVQLGNNQAHIDLARCQALLGRCRGALDRLGEIIKGAIELPHPVAFVDAAIAGGTVWSIAGSWSDGLRHLETAHEVVKRMGFEPRRAHLCAHLVRFLAWKERFDDAEARYEEGLAIARRLGMAALEHELLAARGYAFMQRKGARSAIPMLTTACEFFERTGRLSLLTRAAIDLYWAGAMGGDQAAFDRSAAWLEEFERGYAPLVFAVQAEVGIRFDDRAYARQQIEQLRSASTEAENGWGLTVADGLAQELARLEAGAP